MTVYLLYAKDNLYGDSTGLCSVHASRESANLARARIKGKTWISVWQVHGATPGTE